MSLSVDLISQFAKATKDNKKTKKETTVYGKTVEYDGQMYVQIDGSELLTPVSTTTDMVAGERVTVLIKNHTATVTGNITSPSARTGDVQSTVTKVNALNTKVNSIEAGSITSEDLNVERARIDTLESDNAVIKNSLTAAEANIDTLQTDNVMIKENLTAQSADIESLKTTKLDASIAEITYATIDELAKKVQDLQEQIDELRSGTNI